MPAVPKLASRRPGEAAKTEEKQLKIPVFFVRSALAATKSKYRSKINVGK
jgi:hypothetical protein